MAKPAAVESHITTWLREHRDTDHGVSRSRDRIVVDPGTGSAATS